MPVRKYTRQYTRQSLTSRVTAPLPSVLPHSLGQPSGKFFSSLISLHAVLLRYDEMFYTRWHDGTKEGEFREWPGWIRLVCAC